MPQWFAIAAKPQARDGNMFIVDEHAERQWLARRLVETLLALQHDPNRPEDVLTVDADEDGNGGDDAADALRYLVATKSREVVVRKLRGL